MPLYEYICDNCQDAFEIRQEFHDDPLKRCKQCKKHKLRRIIGVPLYTSVRLAYSEIKTLGHLADRNTQRMSDDEKEAITRKNQITKVEKELPSGMTRVKAKKNKELAERYKKINRMTDEQKDRYIRGG